MGKKDKNWLFIRDARKYLRDIGTDYTFAEVMDRCNNPDKYATPVTQHEISKRHYGRFYYRATTSNALAKRMGVPGRLTKEDFEKVFELGEGLCEICGSESHIIFSKIKAFEDGGTNTVDNLRLLCRVCNMKRTVKDKR